MDAWALTSLCMGVYGKLYVEHMDGVGTDCVSVKDTIKVNALILLVYIKPCQLNICRYRRILRWCLCPVRVALGQERAQVSVVWTLKL